MARARLQVPRSQQGALVRLFDASESDIRTIVEAITATGPALSVRQLWERVAEKTNLPSEMVQDVIRVAASLYTTRDRARATTADFLADVMRAARESGREDLAAPKIGWDAARDRVKLFLSLDGSLGITAKASDLLTENAKVFCDARVITDVRPVFTENVDRPAALILLHTLRLEYHQDGDLKSIRIAMDASDIEWLVSALNRALQKEPSLEALTDKTGLRLVKAQSHGGTT